MGLEGARLALVALLSAALTLYATQRGAGEPGAAALVRQALTLARTANTSLAVTAVSFESATPPAVVQDLSWQLDGEDGVRGSCRACRWGPDVRPLWGAGAFAPARLEARGASFVVRLDSESAVASGRVAAEELTLEFRDGPVSRTLVSTDASVEVENHRLVALRAAQLRWVEAVDGAELAQVHAEGVEVAWAARGLHSLTAFHAGSLRGTWSDRSVLRAVLGASFPVPHFSAFAAAPTRLSATNGSLSLLSGTAAPGSVLLLDDARGLRQSLAAVRVGPSSSGGAPATSLRAEVSVTSDACRAVLQRGFGAAVGATGLEAEVVLEGAEVGVFPHSHRVESLLTVAERLTVLRFALHALVTECALDQTVLAIVGRMRRGSASVALRAGATEIASLTMNATATQLRASFENPGSLAKSPRTSASRVVVDAEVHADRVGSVRGQFQLDNAAHTFALPVPPMPAEFDAFVEFEKALTRLTTRSSSGAAEHRVADVLGVDSFRVGVGAMKPKELGGREL